MDQRTARLRQTSLETGPSISHERTQLLTPFDQAQDGSCVETGAFGKEAYILTDGACGVLALNP